VSAISDLLIHSVDICFYTITTDTEGGKLNNVNVQYPNVACRIQMGSSRKGKAFGQFEITNSGVIHFEGTPPIDEQSLLIFRAINNPPAQADRYLEVAGAIVPDELNEFTRVEVNEFDPGDPG
jgi:hypothetical protein